MRVVTLLLQEMHRRPYEGTPVHTKRVHYFTPPFFLMAAKTRSGVTGASVI